MREVRETASRGWRGLHLLVRMHVLQNLCGRNARHLSELQWRTGEQTTTETIDGPLNSLHRASSGNVVRNGRPRNAGGDRPQSAGRRTLRIFAWLSTLTCLSPIPILVFAS